MSAASSRRRPKDFEALIGLGASARVDGREVRVGSPQLVAQRVAAATFPSEVERWQDEGKTVVFVGTGEELLALLALRDEPRPEAARTIAELRRLGVEHVSMLTGDNERTARSIARELGLDEVFAELKPEDKAAQSSSSMSGSGRSPWSAMASTTHPRWRPPTSASPWAPAAPTRPSKPPTSRSWPTTSPRWPRRCARRRATGISRQNLLFSIVLLAVLIPSAVIGLLTVVVAVAVHEVAELLAVGHGVRAAKRPRPAPAPA